MPRLVSFVLDRYGYAMATRFPPFNASGANLVQCPREIGWFMRTLLMPAKNSAGCEIRIHNLTSVTISAQRALESSVHGGW